MFRENRFWPCFVGAKIQGDKETERGALPVLLWPEQKKYLDENDGIADSDSSLSTKTVDVNLIESNTNNNSSSSSSSSSNSNSNNRKRKVEEISSEQKKQSSSSSSSSLTVSTISPVRGYQNPPSKRLKKTFYGKYILNPIQSTYTRLMNTSQRIFHNLQQSINILTFGLSNKLIKSTLLKKVLNHEEQRYLVFKDLQDRGWFVGPADVYGGDYNIYKDNPSNSHSMATIRVVYNGIVSARDILAYSRVQNQVAKSAVFAFVNNGNDSIDKPISYQVINFQTVSDRM